MFFCGFVFYVLSCSFPFIFTVVKVTIDIIALKTPYLFMFLKFTMT